MNAFFSMKGKTFKELLSFSHKFAHKNSSFFDLGFVDFSTKLSKMTFRTWWKLSGWKYKGKEHLLIIQYGSSTAFPESQALTESLLKGWMNKHTRGKGMLQSFRI